jgi:DNA-binding CsgD family transcriptional regulator
MKRDLITYGLFFLLSGSVVLFSHRLSQKFPLPMLRRFFVFITLYCGFNFLSITAKVFHASYSNRHLGLFSLLTAGILYPLQIGIFYTFSRFSESVGDDHHPKWSRWLIWGPHLVLLIAFLATVLLFGEKSLSIHLAWMIPSYIVAATLSLTIPSALMAKKAPLLTDKSRRKTGRFLGLYFLTCFLLFPLIIEFFAIPFRFLTPPAAYRLIFILMALIPVPPLLYLSINLKKHPLVSATKPSALNDLGSRLKPYGLTPREMEIVSLVLDGRTNAEIGDLLFISTKTIKNNMTSIFRKLPVKNRVQMVGFLLGRQGL